MAKNDQMPVIDRQPTGLTKTLAAFDSNDGGVDLVSKDELIVHQLLDIAEVLFGWERMSRYQILDDNGRQILYVYEVADCYARQCLGGLREFKLKLSTDDGMELLSVYRPLKCTSRCFWACCNLQEMQITDSQGNRIASVHEQWSCMKPHYIIHNDQDKKIYDIAGHMCHCRCCSNMTFKVTRESEMVATITRIWSGCKDVIGAVNDFKIQYNTSLDNKQKSIILAASFLVDVNYFQRHVRYCWC